MIYAALFLGVCKIFGINSTYYLEPGAKYPKINENPQFNNCVLVYSPRLGRDIYTCGK